MTSPASRGEPGVAVEANRSRAYQLKVCWAYVPRLLLLAVVIFALAAPSPASAAPIRECGNYGDKGNGSSGWTYGTVYGAGIFNVTTSRVWCTVARRVSLRAYNTYERGDTVWRWRGWYCKVLASGYESQDTRCRKRRVHVVRWQSGA